MKDIGLASYIRRSFPVGRFLAGSLWLTIAGYGAGDFRTDFAAAALGQDWTARGAVILVIAAAYERTTAKYGKRGRRYVAIEAGHAAQNIYLQAVALGRGATEVGAFDDHAVSRLVRLPSDQEPVTCVAVGRPS